MGIFFDKKFSEMNRVTYILVAYRLDHVEDLRFYCKCNGPPLRHLKDLYVLIHI